MRSLDQRVDTSDTPRTGEYSGEGTSRRPSRRRSSASMAMLVPLPDAGGQNVSELDKAAIRKAIRKADAVEPAVDIDTGAHSPSATPGIMT